MQYENTEVGKPLFIFDGCRACGNALQVMEDRTGRYLKCTSCSRTEQPTPENDHSRQKETAAA